MHMAVMITSCCKAFNAVSLCSWDSSKPHQKLSGKCFERQLWGKILLKRAYYWHWIC